MNAPSFLRRLPLLRGILWRLEVREKEQRLRRQFDAFAARSAELPYRFDVSWQQRRLYADDCTETTTYPRDYVYHCAWAARVLARVRPKRHVDIASSLAFSTLVSAFMPIDFFDFRPPLIQLSALQIGRADLRTLPFRDQSLESLSCMHVIEHVGLGRYGDPLDPEGDLKAMTELERVLAPGGSLLLVVPVGRPRLVFNAHRIYAPDAIRAALPRLRMTEFCLIADDRVGGPPLADASDEVVAEQEYGCGCFRFERLA